MAIEIIEHGKINLEQKFEAKCTNTCCGAKFTFLLKDARNAYMFIECPDCGTTLHVSACRKIPNENPNTPTT